MLAVAYQVSVTAMAGKAGSKLSGARQHAANPIETSLRIEIPPGSK
jgi:hypothetical protein